MSLLPLDSLLSPNLKGVSLLTGPRSIHRLAHAWMSRWALTGSVHVVDCSGSFRPLQILHTLEDQELPAFDLLENIEVQRPRTALQFLGAARILAESSNRPRVILSPLKYFLASASSSAASSLLLEAFRALLATAQNQHNRVLLVEAEQPLRMHKDGMAALIQAAARTWTISAKGVQSLAGNPGLRRKFLASNRVERPAIAAM